eukprot:19663-Hanusia_phi.AAC.2
MSLDKRQERGGGGRRGVRIKRGGREPGGGLSLPHGNQGGEREGRRRRRRRDGGGGGCNRSSPHLGPEDSFLHRYTFVVNLLISQRGFYTLLIAEGYFTSASSPHSCQLPWSPAPRGRCWQPAGK